MDMQLLVSAAALIASMALFVSGLWLNDWGLRFPRDSWGRDLTFGGALLAGGCGLVGSMVSAMALFASASAPLAH